MFFRFFGLMAIAFVVWTVIIFWVWGKATPSKRQIAPADPLEIARERFARGEISMEEFDAIAERLVRTDKSLN